MWKLVIRYKFTHVFNPETTQKQMYDECAKAYVQEFLEGQKNVVMFTYGASSSGKTYTVHGGPEDAGILPRIVGVLLQSLDGLLDSETTLYPEQATVVAQLTPMLLQENQIHKTKIISLSKTMVAMASKNNNLITFNELERLKNESEKIKVPDEHCCYSLWFSYYEIYNEQVFDLLDDAKESRSNLRVVNDRSHTYIDGLKHIQINSIQEAYMIYSYGRYNLSVGTTGINERSSRSHSIFTIKIIGRTTKNSSSYFLHSSLTVCDLAGTERVNRTGNVGQRLKEAQRINSSFLTLNRCLRTIRYNQNSGFTRCIPYRESKLTKILGPSLTSADTCLAMIVTVSQSEELVEETESSLKASSVAATIKATALKPRKPYKASRFSQLVVGERINWNEAVSRGTSSSQDERRKQELLFNKTEEIEFSSQTLANSMERTVPDVYKELDEEKRKRKIADDKLKEMENFYKRELERMESKQRNWSTENMISVLQRKIEEQEDDFVTVKTENLKLKKTIRLLNEDKTKLEDQVKHLEDINKGLNEMLDDAKEEVEDLQSELSNMEKALKEKEEIIVLKDEKLHSLELEILELEQSLENNANEIESYDKQLMVAEEQLRFKKKELQDIMQKFQKLSDDLKKADNELLTLRDRYQIEKDSYSKELDGAHSLLRNYEKQIKSKRCVRRKLTSDDEISSYVPSSNRKAKSTCKKKRERARAYMEIYDSSSSTSIFSDRPITSVKGKKKLFNKNSEDLSEPSSSINRNEDIESSPTSILRRTLRTGKYY